MKSTQQVLKEFSLDGRQRELISYLHLCKIKRTMVEGRTPTTEIQGVGNGANCISN